LYEQALRKREDSVLYSNLAIAYALIGDEKKSRELRDKAIDVRTRQ
jgi:hypothetical protein